MHPRIALALLFSCVTLSGCGPGDSPARDGGGGIDGGDRRDGGGAMDAAPVDGALPEEDAAPQDAGTDAGGCSEDCSAIVAPPCMMAVCNDGSLPGTPGECAMVPLADDTACDDGDFCTVGETCAAGTCAGGAPNDCGMVPGECLEIVCDSVAETCRSQGSAAMNGMPCTYPDLCVTGTTCRDGLCRDGTRLDCSTTPVSGPCQAASCDPATGTCEVMNVNEGGSCVDPADPCVVDDTCTAGVCGGGTTPRDCSAMDGLCVAGVCDPTSGVCTTAPAAEGSACDDGMSCTSATVCTAGVCAGGSSPACSMTSDGCCPATCTDADDADCGCPGELVGGTCVHLPSTVSAADQSSARAACMALGAGWDLCASSLLCMPQILTYLADSGCGCTGGAATCACGTAANVYVHVDGTSPFYVRGPSFPGCLTTMSCTTSVSETCGVPLCCR